MSDSRVRQELERLERLRAADPDREAEIVESWARELAQDGVPDDVAHVAITIRDLYRSAMKPGPVRAKTLVLVLHGIRDQGPWMEMVRGRLAAPDVFVQPIDYEFYDAVRFMTGWGTQRVIHEITEKIRDAQADHPGSALVIIAHSFGTFVVSNILLREPDIRCARLIFCGAVVSKRFQFRRIVRCPQIINECGDRDIWPVFAQGFSLWNRYGAAGVWGLRRTGIHDRFHDFGHNDYLQADFVDRYWKPFVERGEVVDSSYQSVRRDVPWGVSLLSYGWRLIWWGLAGLIIALGGAWWLQTAGCPWLAIAVALMPLLVAGLLLIKIVGDVRKFHVPLNWRANEGAA